MNDKLNFNKMENSNNILETHTIKLNSIKNLKEEDKNCFVKMYNSYLSLVSDAKSVSTNIKIELIYRLFILFMRKTLYRIFRLHLFL